MRGSQKADVEDSDEVAHGLVYLDGKYRKIGETIDAPHATTKRIEEKQTRVPESDSRREVIHKTFGMNVRRGDEYMR